jgi:hypothetical protein
VDREVARTEDYICSTTPQCRMCRVVRLLSEARRRSSWRQGKTPITMAPDINVRKVRLRRQETQNGRVQWLSNVELQARRRAGVASS